jgi:hypothetical protein
MLFLFYPINLHNITKDYPAITNILIKMKEIRKPKSVADEVNN